MEDYILNCYMSFHYKMVVCQDDEGMYTAYFPDLPGCITTGETPEELIKNAEDAKRCWLKAALEDGVTISEPTDLGYSL